MTKVTHADGRATEKDKERLRGMVEDRGFDPQTAAFIIAISQGRVQGDIVYVPQAACSGRQGRSTR